MTKLSIAMLAKEITSLQHPIVKQAALLRRSKKERLLRGQVLISGIKQVNEAPSRLITFVEKGSSCELSTEETYVVTSEILKKITGLEAPEPLAALVALPQQSSLQGARRILGLDRISDPGNLGTLLRTALALGWEGVFLMNGCVDPFNDKALRAAKGATFSMPMREGSLEELRELAKEEAMVVLIADSHGASLESPSIIEKREGKILLILGNESAGPSLELKAKFAQVAIPISKAESLNVAMAGAILMYGLGEAKKR